MVRASAAVSIALIAAVFVAVPTASIDMEIEAPSTAVEAVTASILAIPFSPTSAESCAICDTCGNNGHVAPGYALGNRTSSVADHTGCYEAQPDCNPSHPYGCEPEEDADVVELAAAWHVITSDDPDQIAGLLARAPTQFYLNEGRAALQVFSCNGDVVASIPLSTATMTTLLE